MSAQQSERTRRGNESIPWSPRITALGVRRDPLLGAQRFPLPRLLALDQIGIERN